MASGARDNPERAEVRRKRRSGEVVQSGDLQGLPDVPEAESESVRELAEEGQAFEAEVVSGIENAPPADADEVKTKEVPEDDVPIEYLHDQDEPKE